jgi:hypothetical protein
MGIGQRSSAGELTGSTRFTGAPKEASTVGRCATQMSSPPKPFGRSEARYRLSPSGDSIGQPSRSVVLVEELFPAISSSFCAGSQAEKWGAGAAVAASDATRP